MGKLRESRNDGYILIDVLITLLVISIGFGSLMFGMRVAGREAVRQHERIRTILSERNEQASLSRVFTLEE